MSRILCFLALLAALAIPLIFVMSRSSAEVSGLPPTEEEYANGWMRRKAVFEKVVPGLKEAFAEKELVWGSPVFLRAFKEERILEVWVKKDKGFVLFKSYPIRADSGKLGPKLKEGDLQIPEGFYYFTPEQMNPRSQFHLSFNIGYPNEFDKAHERDGTFIMVHGSNVSIGCLAIGDDKIEEVYSIVHHAFKKGQKFCRIHLFPFRMSEENMTRHSGNQWLEFWKNLRTGYQWFEEKKTPPNTTVREKRYHFE